MLVALREEDLEFCKDKEGKILYVSIEGHDENDPPKLKLPDGFGNGLVEEQSEEEVESQEHKEHKRKEVDH